MATTINADISTGGLIATGDSSGNLGLQSDGTTLATLSGSKVLFEAGISEEYVELTSSGNATTVNLNSATNFSHTLSEDTTFTFSNAAASGRVSAFGLKIVQDSSASGHTITWPSGVVYWAGGTAPTLTATASAVDQFVFYSHDSGVKWYGFVAGQDMAQPS